VFVTAASGPLPGGGVRGEVTIVVAGATPGAGVPTDDESLRAAVAEREAAGMSRKEAIVEVARSAGVPKRQVYAVVHLGAHEE
jgi:16S rRNA (cytidine1402-2'-O)-methyltransferase